MKMETHLYRFYWLDGVTTVQEGTSVEDAFSKAGYGAGAIRALDFYDVDKAEPTYSWDSETRNWVKKPEGDKHA